MSADEGSFPRRLSPSASGTPHKYIMKQDQKPTTTHHNQKPKSPNTQTLQQQPLQNPSNKKQKSNLNQPWWLDFAVARAAHREEAASVRPRVAHQRRRTHEFHHHSSLGQGQEHSRLRRFAERSKNDASLRAPSVALTDWLPAELRFTAPCTTWRGHVKTPIAVGQQEHGLVSIGPRASRE